MKKTRRFLSAALAAAVFGSASAYVAFADEPSKVPEGYHGLALTANGSGDIYGVTMTEAQLKALPYSEADASAGRTDPGYYAGFYVDALNTGKNGGTASYARAYTYVADLNDATIKGLTYGAGSSTDGQFWPRFIKSHLSPTNKNTPQYLVYAIKATYDNDTSNPMYYYIAVDWKDIPEDFAFDDSENCAGTHSPSKPCTICGNTADVEYESVSTDFPAGFTDPDRKAAAKKITDKISGVEVEDGEVVVTFTKTKKEIEEIIAGDDDLKKGAEGGGVDPIYLDIATNIPGTVTPDNFAWENGYGWDDENNKSFNFNDGHIMLWLKAEKDNDTITYKVNNGKEQTLKVNYNYAKSNYLTLKMASGTAEIEYSDNGQQVRYPDLSNNVRFAIPVGSTGSITINSSGKTVKSVKLGSATTKREAVKNGDKYEFTVQTGDTEIEVIFAGSTGGSGSTTKPSTTTTKPAADPTKNPPTGIALATAPAVLAAGAVIVAAKKRK